MTYAVTLDFHNTLAQCESWFELEVRGLLPRFLEWHAGETGRDLAAETRCVGRHGLPRHPPVGD